MTAHTAEAGAPRPVVVDTVRGATYIRASAYLLWLPPGKPYALLADARGIPWGELFLAPSLHTREHLDDTTRLDPPRVEATPRGQRVVITAASTAWAAKEVVLDCEPEHLAVTVTVEGAGSLTDVHLLAGYYSGDRKHGSGFYHSGADFRSVFNPEPWGSERRVLPAAQPTILDVMGGSVPGAEHWLFTPPPLCVGVSRTAPPDDRDEIPEGPWTMIGLGAGPGEHTFTAMHYEAVEAAFSLRLAYEGHTAVDGRFTAPAVLFSFDAPDPYTGIARYVEHVHARGDVPRIERPPAPDWWSEPLLCGWGSQCALSAAGGGKPRDYATQEHYDAFLAALAAHDLRPGTIVLDDKWQAEYGTNRADEKKWPDLRAWIDERHADGQRVLLWWKAWDPEGLPESQCVRNAAGAPMATDPTNPDYEETLRASVRHMLGADGYDADGFKVDFSGRTPSGPGLVRHGEAWGMELLHRLLAIVYDEAKRTKPDALVMTHTPNPYFAAVTDMIRLNDVNTRAPVVPQMVHRARVARAACPGLLVDTDNWPMPDPESFREYIAIQPDLGIPSLYYATHLERLPAWTKNRDHVAWEHYRELRREDGASFHQGVSERVDMTADDYAIVRQAWRRYQEEQR